MNYYSPYRSSSNNYNVELDLSNYATKDGVKKLRIKSMKIKKKLFLLEDFFYMNIIVILFMIVN